MADGGATAFLEAQSAAHPELASWYAELADLYNRKLWHQLTVKLEQFLAHVLSLPAPKGGPTGLGAALIPLYHSFIADLASRINVLKLAHFAVIVSRQYTDLPAATEFLNSVIAKLKGQEGADGAGSSSGASSSKLIGGGGGGGGPEGSKQKARRIEEAVVYVSMQMAALKLQSGEQRECKQLLDQARATLDATQGAPPPPLSSLTAGPAPSLESSQIGPTPADNGIPSGSVSASDPAPVAPASAGGKGVATAAVAGDEVDPSVQASVFWVQSQYCKSRQDFAEFYRAALLYLAYVAPHTLTEPFKLDLAVDLSLASLLGENVYNFGELLAHPIVGVLEGSSFEWLLRMLQAFEAGDLAQYDALCRTYSQQLNAQPALVANQNRLREKITILCLLNLIFSVPAEERKIPLRDIAKRTQLPLEGVEHLLMKTLSAHLVEGVIDQVDSTVQVSWVQPRVLSVPQVAALRTRLDSWLDRVHSTLLSVEAETPELLAS